MCLFPGKRRSEIKFRGSRLRKDPVRTETDGNCSAELRPLQGKDTLGETVPKCLFLTKNGLEHWSTILKEIPETSNNIEHFSLDI